MLSRISRRFVKSVCMVVGIDENNECFVVCQRRSSTYFVAPATSGNDNTRLQLILLSENNFLLVEKKSLATGARQDN